MALAHPGSPDHSARPHATRSHRPSGLGGRRPGGGTGAGPVSGADAPRAVPACGSARSSPFSSPVWERGRWSPPRRGNDGSSRGGVSRGQAQTADTESVSVCLVAPACTRSMINETRSCLGPGRFSRLYPSSQERGRDARSCIGCLRVVLFHKLFYERYLTSIHRVRLLLDIPFPYENPSEPGGPSWIRGSSGGVDSDSVVISVVTVARISAVRTPDLR